MLSLHTCLVVLHLQGVVLGVGGATAADFLILRRAVFSPIEKNLVDTIAFISRLVTGGLILLWVSGIGLFFEIWQNSPAYHTNQKLWAKVAIVVVLTLNAYIIHHIILPRLKRQISLRLFSGLTMRETLSFALSSSISGVSWYLPLVLGPAKELSYVVPFATILSVYAWLLLSLTLAMVCLAIWTTRKTVEAPSRMLAGEQEGFYSPPLADLAYGDEAWASQQAYEDIWPQRHRVNDARRNVALRDQVSSSA